MKFDHGKALTRAEALEALKARWEFEKRTEHVPVGEACGRVLAQDCHAAYDLPRHRVSSFDGIAVRAADFAQGVPTPANGCVACTSPRPIPAMTSPTSSTRS